jgi:hypothetical protein
VCADECAAADGTLDA